MADTTKPEIVQLLRRIKELSDWAKAEAGGYESTEGLPDYRKQGS
ncbi:MAG: hypothetical protein ACJ788_13335 [Ktedonobacteraceae bacterium]|jgi:hypothetical protein